MWFFAWSRFQCLVSLMMSSQTRDEVTFLNVNKFWIISALCVDLHCKVSIGQYNKMCTSPLIFSSIISDDKYLKKIFDNFHFHFNSSWKRLCTLSSASQATAWFGDELNGKSNSWTQIFWMAQVTLFKYLIISNNYFTMNGFTDKDGVLVIIFANNLIYMWQKFQPCKTSPSVFPPKMS